MARDPQLYEIGFLIKPEIPAEKAVEILGEIRSYVEKHGGISGRVVEPKIHTLAYPIKKITQAYFSALQFTVAPDVLSVIAKNVESHSELVRHLIVSWKQEPDRLIIPQRSTRNETTSVSRSKISTPEKPTRTVDESIDDKVSEEEIDKKLDEILGD